MRGLGIKESVTVIEVSSGSGCRKMGRLFGGKGNRGYLRPDDIVGRIVRFAKD